MKQKLIIGVALLGILFFSNCQSEEFENDKNFVIENDVSVKSISFNSLRTINSNAYNKYQKLINMQSKGIQDESISYKIDKTSICYIKKVDGYESFTFKVITDSENLLQNVMIDHKPDGTSSVELIEYNLDIPLIPFATYQDIEQHVTTINFYDISELSIIHSRSRTLCVDIGYWITVDKCEGELVTPRSNPSCFNADGTKATKDVFIITASACSDGGGGSFGPVDYPAPGSTTTPNLGYGAGSSYQQFYAALQLNLEQEGWLNKSLFQGKTY